MDNTFYPPVEQAVKCYVCGCFSWNIFCDGPVCARTYYRYTMRRIIDMNHSFVVGGMDKAKCAKCGYTMLDHTKAAQCESCGKRDNCDVIDNMLMCPDCFKRHTEAVVEPQLNSEPEVKQTIQEIVKSADISIRYNGDAFNARIPANIDIKNEIWADETLSEAEKHYKLQNILSERIITFRKVMFDCDEKKYNAALEANAALHVLREFAGILQKDVQEKLRESDKTYVPTIKAPVKTGAIRGPKESPMDKLARMFAELHGVTKEKAIEMIKSGKKPA